MADGMLGRFLLIYLGAPLMFPALSAAAESSSALNCSATKQPDGLIKYQLSQAPSSPECKTWWENQGIIVAHLFSFSSDHVHNVTTQYIIIKKCVEYLRFILDCPQSEIEYEVTYCRVNCSVLMDQDRLPNTGDRELAFWKLSRAAVPGTSIPIDRSITEVEWVDHTLSPRTVVGAFPDSLSA
ncbi:hypothetical protein Q5P01_015547 [Channa striata]|uniref:Uncharacterized protein n=1 Tax=Channa striata TaxID=64152 RepID=A0AA88SKL4_CHASR|nr:hypothetical protein Q5P01_015547 [Channa striata]